MKFPQGFLGGVNATASGSCGICPSWEFEPWAGNDGESGNRERSQCGMWASPLGRGIWDFLEFLPPGALHSGLSIWGRSRNTTSGCAIPGDTFPADSNNKTSWKDPQGWILAVEFCPSQQGSEKAGNG